LIVNRPFSSFAISFVGSRDASYNHQASVMGR